MVKESRTGKSRIPTIAKLIRLRITTIAALLTIIASLFAAICWITSGKAGGTASDQKTAALGFMILRLESSTESSTARVQAQTYLTQAEMYFARAEATDNENLKTCLDNLGYLSVSMSNFYIGVAENSENKAQTYYGAYEEAIGAASSYGKVADYRSTGALIFNVGAMICGTAGLLKRKELLYTFIPIFAIGAGYLVMSLF